MEKKIITYGIETEIPSEVINEYEGLKHTGRCTCIWCGSKMKRGGATHVGAGVNSFSLWCDNCGAVVVHACNFGKKITGYEVKWDVE